MAEKTVRAGASFWLYTAFIAALLANFSFWMHSRKILPEWSNVPPAPSVLAASMATLGDAEVAHRLTGYFLQNIGNTGGRYEPLQNYDYAALEKWLLLADGLNPRSDFAPFLAAYYFGTLFDEPEKMRHIAQYLAIAGLHPYPEKWRWLAHAVFLARYRVEDMTLALDYANILASMPGDVAIWGRQMPAFVQLDMDNKQASYEIMIRILATEGEKIHPNEVNFMKDFICTRTLDLEEAAQNPLCQE